jgi:putative transposase
MPGVKVEPIGFGGDHLHMVMIIPPKYSISSVMGSLKSQLASRMRTFFPWLEKVYWKENRCTFNCGSRFRKILGGVIA